MSQTVYVHVDRYLPHKRLEHQRVVLGNTMATRGKADGLKIGIDIRQADGGYRRFEVYVTQDQLGVAVRTADGTLLAHAQKGRLV